MSPIGCVASAVLSRAFYVCERGEAMDERHSELDQQTVAPHDATCKSIPSARIRTSTRLVGWVSGYRHFRLETGRTDPTVGREVW